MKLIRFFIALMLIAGFSFLLNYSILLHQKAKKVENEAKEIEVILSDSFERIEKIISFIGRRIVDDSQDFNLKIIHQVFIQTAAIHDFNNIFSWSLFDWVDAEGYQSVNTMIGVRKNPPYMADRNYRSRANKNWNLIFSELTIGVPSGMRVIPIGVQIDNKKSQYAGTVTAGINVKKLTSLVSAQLDKNIHFAVVDSRSNKFVFGSRDAEKYFNDIHFGKTDFTDDNQLIFTKNMEEKYPYRIFSRYGRDEFWREVVQSSMILTMQIIGTALAVMFLQKITKPDINHVLK